jgi:hypothetical protein
MVCPRKSRIRPRPIIPRTLGTRRSWQAMAGPDAYAGLMLLEKATSFRNRWPFGRSVRDREIAGSNPAFPTTHKGRAIVHPPSATAALSLRVGRSRRAGPPRPPSRSAPRRRRASSGCTPDALLLLHDPESLARTSDRLGAEYARVPQHDGLERPCSFCTAASWLNLVERWFGEPPSLQPSSTSVHLDQGCRHHLCQNRKMSKPSNA